MAMRAMPQFNLAASPRENETEMKALLERPARLEHQFAPAESKPQEYFLADILPPLASRNSGWIS